MHSRRATPCFASGAFPNPAFADLRRRRQVIHYTAKLAKDGTVVDTSVGKEPLRVRDPHDSLPRPPTLISFFCFKLSDVR